MTLFDNNGRAMKSLYVFNDISGAPSKTSSGVHNGASLDGTYYIKNVFSGLYLDVANGSGDNNANIQQYTYEGSARQQFKLVSAGDGYYTIYTGASGFRR